MQAGLEVTRSIEDDLADLDETDQAIQYLGKRLEAQEQRIAQLTRDGIDSTSAEQIRASIRDSLKELIMHRALIIHALARRDGVNAGHRTAWRPEFPRNIKA
ncbi:hypothetical protein [Cupriavidus neocaledonicus]|uniref:hypothetical protein n=1 Tax=Cupriavidus neocaledonicus TaxID=1040979 RepID=UPI00035C975F|nr:hypothetical protein [Cupriavidus neocaledonicus]